MPDMAGSSKFQQPCSQGGGPSGKDNLGNKKHHIKITARAREKSMSKTTANAKVRGGRDIPVQLWRAQTSNISHRATTDLQPA